MDVARVRVKVRTTEHCAYRQCKANNKSR